MNINNILDKLEDFCVNYSVAAFAVAAFQKNPSASLVGIAALVFAAFFAASVRK